MGGAAAVFLARGMGVLGACLAEPGGLLGCKKARNAGGIRASREAEERVLRAWARGVREQISHIRVSA